MSIPITYLRASSYNTHEMCPMKYFIEYVLGFSGKSNKKADKGTIFHKVMEIIAHIKLADQNKEDRYIDDIVGEIIIPNNLFDINLNDIYDKVYEYYTSNIDHHEWENKDRNECWKWVNKALEFNGGFFDPRNQIIIKPEQSFDIELKQDWAAYDYPQYNLKGNLRLMGTIDQITDAGDGVYEILDWKTGKNINWATGIEYDYSNIHTNFQLRFYHLVCSILFPHIKTFCITIYFLNHNSPITMTLDVGDVYDTLEIVREKFEEIRDTNYPELNITWKCKKFCDCGTTTFEDTNVQPIIARGKTNFSTLKKPMKKCDQVDYVLRYRTIEETIKNMSKDGHHISNYKKPGSIE